MSKAHSFDIRVYYEDTDAGGVVYYANYLKYAERARTELLRARKINQSELAKNEGIFFVVRRVELDLIKPARLDDLITISTEIKELSGVRIEMEQILSKGKERLAVANVLIACVSADFRPKRLSEKIKKSLVT